MSDDKILEPVFLIPHEDDRGELLIAIKAAGYFGLSSVKVSKGRKIVSENGKPIWGYRLRRFQGKGVIEVKPEINFFHGRMITPTIWRPEVHICSQERRQIIIDWIDSLNHRINHYGT